MDQTSNTQVPIQQQVGDILKEYLDSPNKSKRGIEFYTGVSRHYVGRLQECSIDSEKIDPIKLYKVLKLIKGTDFALDYINKNQEWSSKLAVWNGFKADLVKKSVDSRDIESVVMSDDYSLTVFVLSLSNSGITMQDIRDIGGMLLVKAAERLASEGIIVENNGFYKSAVIDEDGKFFTFSREKLGRVIDNVNKFYNPENSGQNRNYRYVITNTFSDEFIKEAYGKVDELRKWWTENSRKESSMGDNPFFFTMVMDTFTDKLKNDKRVLQ